MKNLWIFGALLSLLMVGCSKDEGAMEGGMPIEIQPVIEAESTRATALNFEEGDQMALSVKMDVSGVNHFENKQFTFTDGSFRSSENLVWYSDLNLASTLVAVYPFTAGGAGEFTVQADQTGAQFTASDLMFSKVEGVTPSLKPQPMVFKHQLTKLNLAIENPQNVEIRKVEVKGAIPTAVVDWTNLQVAVKEAVAPVSVVAHEVTVNSAYKAIIVPQTATLEVHITVFVDGGERVLVQKFAAQTLTAGSYNLPISLAI